MAYRVMDSFWVCTSSALVGSARLRPSGPLRSTLLICRSWHGHSHARTHTDMYFCTRACMHVRSQSCVHTVMCVHTCMYAHTCTYAPMHAHTHAYTHPCSSTQCPRATQTPKPQGNNYTSRNYVGHNSIGHNYLGHDYLGHNCTGHKLYNIGHKLYRP